MLDENDVNLLADSFFQNESYVSNNEEGSYKQINLNQIIPVIKRTNNKILVEAYNIALVRIKELVDQIFNALIYLGKDKTFNLKEYLSIEIPIIHSYMERIYEIRNAFLKANSRNITIFQKKSCINRIFGDFDDIFFLEDELYKFIPEKNRNDKNVVELANYIKEEYIKYSEKHLVSKTR